MSVLVSRQTRVLVQGITGKVGEYQTAVMLKHGTTVVAGVTPGKGGAVVHGVPVYDFVREAVEDTEANAAIAFVPAVSARGAALEAISAGIEFAVVTASNVPVRDTMDILNAARANGVRVLGPDTPGLVAPGLCKLGVHPERFLRMGTVGVVSRSGALSYEVCKHLVEAGLGQSSVVGIGGGPLWDLDQSDLLRLFQADPQTEAIVLLGEVGGTMEHRAAKVIREEMNKPVIALVVGRSAPHGRKMGHAGAIISGPDETAVSKIDALKASGALIARNPLEVVDHLRGVS